MSSDNLVTRPCRGCHPAIPICLACDGTGVITSPGGIVTSKELIAMGDHPGVKDAIAPKSRWA